jgi:hypothetical protein
MAANNLTSANAWKLPYQPITATSDGSGTQSAFMYAGKIVVDINDLASGKIVTVSTPIAIEVIDCYAVVKESGGVASKTVTLKNSTDAISTALSVAATDGLVSRTTKLFDTKANFDVGDDDMNLVSSAHAAGDFYVVISYTKQFSVDGA